MYIERDKLLRQLEIVPSYGRYIDIEAVEGLVRDMPAADVVEVVRCGQCKWWPDDRCQNVNGAHTLVFNPKWFCGSGERREA